MSDIDKRLYALPDCTIQPIDGHAIMLIRIDNGAVAAIDARWQPFLNDLRVFRTLKDHATTVAQRIPDLRGHEQGLEDGFKQLVPRGLFYSADEVVAQFESSSKRISTELKPLTLCIRTCDRPDFLRALLQSLAENAQTFATRWPIEILEDSKQEHNRDQNRALGAEFAQQLNLAYIGLEKQENFIGKLCASHPEDCDSLRWLLDANHPENTNQATHGRLYNLAFLLHAGERILLIDDDTVMKAWQLPTVKAQPQFQLLAESQAAFANPEEAYAYLHACDADPIAAHADYLGLPVADAIRQLTGQAISPEWFAGLSIDDVPHQYALPGRVRYTHNGFIGDTGATADHQRFFRMRLDDPELVLDATRYEQFRQSPRFAFSGTDRPAFLSGTHFHHTTCAGLDLTNLAPPVLPRGRSEDALLGAQLRLLYPGDFGLRQPFALEHRIHAAKPWAFDPELLSRPADHSTAMGLWANLLAAPAEVTPDQRLQLLLQSIINAADEGILEQRLEQMLDRRKHESLALQFAVSRGELAARTAKTASGDMNIPVDSPWRKEMDTLSQWLIQRLHQAAGLSVNNQVSSQISSDMLTFAKAMPAWIRVYQSLI